MVARWSQGRFCERSGPTLGQTAKPPQRCDSLSNEQLFELELEALRLWLAGKDETEIAAALELERRGCTLDLSGWTRATAEAHLLGAHRARDRAQRTPGYRATETRLKRHRLNRWLYGQGLERPSAYMRPDGTSVPIQPDDERRVEALLKAVAELPAAQRAARDESYGTLDRRQAARDATERLNTIQEGLKKGLERRVDVFLSSTERHTYLVLRGLVGEDSRYRVCPCGTVFRRTRTNRRYCVETCPAARQRPIKLPPGERPILVRRGSLSNPGSHQVTLGRACAWCGAFFWAKPGQSHCEACGTEGARKARERRGQEVEAILERLTRWAEQRRDVRALALVGSRARGTPRGDSDVDVVLLTDSPSSYIDHDDWLASVGGIRLLKTAEWGAITERRFAVQSGLEVELGVGAPAWASVNPLDDGTRRVVSDGMRALYDPEGVLAALAASCGAE